MVQVVMCCPHCHLLTPSCSCHGAVDQSRTYLCSQGFDTYEAASHLFQALFNVGWHDRVHDARNIALKKQALLSRKKPPSEGEQLVQQRILMLMAQQLSRVYSTFCKIPCNDSEYIRDILPKQCWHVWMKMKTSWITYRYAMRRIFNLVVLIMSKILNLLVHWKSSKASWMIPLKWMSENLVCIVICQHLYCFKDDKGRPLTVTSAHYVHMIQTFLIEELAHYPNVIWFQQDEATAHTANIPTASIGLLFPNQIYF